MYVYMCVCVCVCVYTYIYMNDSQRQPRIQEINIDYRYSHYENPQNIKNRTTI